ncbi:c-type cytochrome domain-containing protein [Sorangium sp. So ce1014]|uniref:c-type cytochrome domain-containing protein n=1 Tax=Sorangium sp. So ce1014 TaxID=3133326 RepID=UPI003F5DEC49
MTFIASLYGRTALAVSALMSGAALLASCAGTLDDDFKDEYATGGDGAGAGDGQGTGQAAATSGGGAAAAATTATTGGEAAATTATTGGEAAATTATTGGEAAATTATTGGGPDCGDVPALIVNTCGGANCHNATTRASGLALTAGFETMIKNQPSGSCGGSVLVPGQPDMSSLYTKITATNDCNNRMPLNQPALMDEQIACVRDWIMTLPP